MDLHNKAIACFQHVASYVATYICQFILYIFVDPNIDTSSMSSSTIFCYTNDICTEGEVNQGAVLNFNDCCGDNVFTPSYRIGNGPCSPCKSILVTNDCIISVLRYIRSYIAM